jgi:hypothetical protein
LLEASFAIDPVTGRLLHPAIASLPAADIAAILNRHRPPVPSPAPLPTTPEVDICDICQGKAFPLSRRRFTCDTCYYRFLATS